jgi:putative transcriptional regulator
MAKAAFDKIMAGVNDAITYVDGTADKSVYGIHAVSGPDIKAIRAKTGLSQAKFCQAFAIQKRALEDWEQGRRSPSGPALVLLTLIDREPQTVLRALRAG